MLVCLLLLVCAAFYALSHRLFMAYVTFVSHEERFTRLGRRKRGDAAERTTAPTTHHIGPRCFLVLDLTILGVAILSLRRFLSFEDATASWEHLLSSFAALSLLSTLWLLRAGQHFSHYYANMLHAVRGWRAAADRENSSAWKLVRPLVIVWSAVPLGLYILGFEDALAAHGSLWRGVAIFLVWFLGPQAILAGYFFRRLWPLRQNLYKL